MAVLRDNFHNHMKDRFGDPLHIYRMDEAAGTNIVDAGSNADDGTISGAYTLSQAGLIHTDADEAGNNCIRFGAAAGDVVVPGTALTGPWTAVGVIQNLDNSTTRTVLRFDAGGSEYIEVQCSSQFKSVYFDGASAHNSTIASVAANSKIVFAVGVDVNNNMRFHVMLVKPATGDSPAYLNDIFSKGADTVVAGMALKGIGGNGSQSDFYGDVDELFVVPQTISHPDFLEIASIALEGGSGGPRIHSNNASGTLAAAFNIGDTELQLSATEAKYFGLPSSTQIERLTLDDGEGNVEIMHAIRRDGVNVEVVRAREGTKERDWLLGATIEGRVTADILDSPGFAAQLRETRRVGDKSLMIDANPTAYAPGDTSHNGLRGIANYGYAVSVGVGNRLGFFGATAVGVSNYAAGFSSVAMGKSNKAVNSGAAIGKNMNIFGYSAGVGNGGYTPDGYSYNTVMGNWAYCYNGNYSLSIGYWNFNYAEKALSVGAQSQIKQTAPNSVLFGIQAYAYAPKSVVMGQYTKVKLNANYGVAVGYFAEVRDSSNAGVAIGANVAVQIGSSYAVGLGSYSSIQGLATIGVGSQNNLDGNMSVSVGYNNNDNSSNGAVMLGSYKVGRGYVMAAPAHMVHISNGFPNTDNWNENSGSEVIVMTHEVDLTAVANFVTDIPAGTRFFPDEVGVVITDQSGSGGGAGYEPTLRWGETVGAPQTVYADVALSNLDGVGNRAMYTSLLTNNGLETSILMGVSAWAGGAEVLKGRMYMKGMLVAHPVGG